MNLHLKLSYLNWKFTLTLGCLNSQSWSKVLGTVLQYSYFSVFSWFPITRVHPFRNFLTVHPPPPPLPTLYKVETGKKILDTRVQHCLWCEGRSWTYVYWKTPQKRRIVPRLSVHVCSYENAGPWQNREEAVSNFFKGRVTIKVKFDDWRTTIQ